MRKIPTEKADKIAELSANNPNITNREIASIVGVGIGTVHKYRSPQKKRIYDEIKCMSDKCSNMFTPDNKAQKYCCFECRKSTHVKKPRVKVIKKVPIERTREVIMIEYTNKINEIWRILNVEK